jgi:hypothetical protein
MTKPDTKERELQAATDFIAALPDLCKLSAQMQRILIEAFLCGFQSGQIVAARMHIQPSRQ